MKRRNIFVTALLALLCLEVCEGIWCFVCHTDIDPGCGDKFSISTSDIDLRRECSGLCMKRRGKRGSGSVSRTEIHRSCQAFGSEGCYSEFFNGINQYTCLCSTDFCNGAPSSHHYGQSQILLAFLPIIIAASMKIWSL